MAHKNRRIEKSALFLILIFFILVVTAIILVFSLQTDPVSEILENDELLKVLFVLEDGGTVLFSDVFVYYPVSTRGTLFSIPGNTGAIYSSLGRVDRIDAVFTEKGIDAYRAEIGKLIGQTIPFSIVMNLGDFQKLVDLLGGLRIFVPYPVDAASDTGERWLLPSGSVNLDGDKIRTYLLYTVPEESAADIQERRQHVMVALLGALNRNSPRIFSAGNFTPYGKLLHANMDTKYVRRLLSVIAQIDSERLVPQTVTGSSRAVDGQTLLFPYYDGQLIKDVVKQSIGSLASASETVYSRIYVLEIQNGTAVQGLARNTAALLQGAGYDVLSSVNADSNDYEKTVIINHIGNEDVAKTLGDFIRCTNIVVDEVLPEEAGSDLGTQVDFTIILGKDFDGRYVR
ncbi:LCP family protein [Treponema brennaborense]|uniref:LytR/CpsA/Psr regulator C-terminal domain-containing protein n=1 Tax=Treponema brennaborense (strain DSM 12168 / CIP 105900 / DD5/3) TaxID=906968 RepID=F4LQI8_TREBD|nr:LCP family protein [Treponema brennaborense]AEE17197.1 hypothetical protein Trebr_1775 [Treponema brennaborense DSM 12168]